MRIITASRRTGFAALALAAVFAGMQMFAAAQTPARAGAVADWAGKAESLLDSGDSAGALTAFDKAFAAFWTASPLQLRVAVFADDVEGYGHYTPHADPTFKPGDTLTVYLEPVGFAFTRDGDQFEADVTADIEIRTPGGIILAKAPNFGQLTWSGRSPTHEVHAKIGLPLPDLKPGNYDLLITLRDGNSPKTTTVTLPFSVDATSLNR